MNKFIKVSMPQGGVLVDETARIKKGDSYIDFLVYPDLITTHLIYSGVSYTDDLILQSTTGTTSPRISSKKIIATINHSISLDIPMVIVEDEVEKLAELDRLNTGWEDTANLPYTSGFIRGYKAAQQKGVYSEEDIRKAISNAVYTINPMLLGSKDYDIEENRIIQSLKQEHIELEMEYKDGYNNWFFYDKEFWNKQNNKPKFGTRIKTTRVDGQLIAYVKF